MTGSTIRTRLILVFGCLVSILVGLTVFSRVNFSHIESLQQVVTYQSIPAIELSGNITANFEQLSTIADRIAVSGDSEERAALLEEIGRVTDDLEKYMFAIADLSVDQETIAEMTESVSMIAGDLVAAIENMDRAEAFEKGFTKRFSEAAGFVRTLEIEADSAERAGLLGMNRALKVDGALVSENAADVQAIGWGLELKAATERLNTVISRLENADSVEFVNRLGKALTKMVAALDPIVQRAPIEVIRDKVMPVPGKMAAALDPENPEAVQAYLIGILESRAVIDENIASVRDSVATMSARLRAVVGEQNRNAEGAAGAVGDAIESADSIFTAFTVAAVLLAVGMYWRIVHRDLLGRLGVLKLTMDELAAGNSDVEVRGADRKDELGAMAGSVVVFRDNAVKAREAEEEQAERDRKAAEGQRAEMARIARDFEETMGGVVSAINDISQVLEQNSESMISAMRSTVDDSVAAADLAGRTTADIDSITKTTGQLSASIAEISRQVQTSSEITSRAVTESESTAEHMRNLEKAGEQIGSVMSLITEIAEQTNLLALNATIEAARAGDAGKGFAVVANEVKSLSGQTAKATDDIDRQVSGMRDITAQAQSAMTAIGSTISETENIAGSVSAAVEEQSTATGQIAATISEAATGVRSLNATISTVSKTISGVGEQAGDLAGIARNLSDQADRLRVQSDSFLKTIRSRAA